VTAAVSVEEDLRTAVAAAAPRLLALSEAEAGRSPVPGKWSPKEVIGHLIDSASNNHGRFVRAQFEEDLVFLEYEQDSWVASQRYRTAPWNELVGLWRLLNLHIARVIEALPASVRERPRERHNFDRTAWRPVPRETPSTLEYFLRDYVGHMKHHLGQIRGAGGAGF
jgi:hypothetical protein